MKYIFYLIALFMILTAQGQDQSNLDLSQCAQDFLRYSHTKKYDSIIEMMYPPTLQAMSNIEIKAEMQKFFNGTDAYKINLRSEIPAYNRISQIYSHDSTQYAFALYDLRMAVSYLEKIQEDGRESVLANLKQKGMDAYFINDNRINVVMRNSLLIFIKDSKSHQKWSLVNFDHRNSLNFKIIPSFVLKDLAEFLNSINE